MSSLDLTGIDAQNPLGFLAALGLLKVLDEHARNTGASLPKLSFADQGRLVPRLWTELTLDDVIERVLIDAKEQSTNLILQLAYTDDGGRVVASTAGARRDLKPSPEVARAVLEEAAGASRRVSDLGAGLFCELVQDNNGNTKPTALHFTAGQQAFLSMVDMLRKGLTRENVLETLFGPWMNRSPLPSLSWDSTVSRSYALRASDPSQEKRGSVPAANWLGVQALAFLPVSKRGRRLQTACVKGGWKTSVIAWPVWSSACTAPVVHSLLRLDTTRMTSRERAALGVETVLQSKIARSDQGGYGSFSPASVVPPAADRRARVPE